MNNSKRYKRIETKASHTALMAVIYRFLATKEKRQSFTGPDYLARIFLPPKAKFFLAFSFLRNIFIKKLHEKGPGSYEYVTARTKFFDDLFIKELKRNIPQIVFLGAGYDTRSLRLQGILGQTQIFELDVKTTQNKKINLLKKNEIQIPENLHFIAINFDRDNLKQVLLEAGYDSSKRTLFILEGVTMYISEDAINKTLFFVKNYSGQESTIVFDYLYKSVIRNECTYYGAKELSEIVKQKGEPFEFGIEEGKIIEFLNEKGFSPVAYYTHYQMEQKYLRNNNDGFFGKMYGFACHVHAKVKTDYN